MRVQRKIVYITGALAAISIVLYFICVFVWNPIENTICWKWKTFTSNITLALLGSALLSLIVSYLSYCDCKTKALEHYKKIFRDLFDLSGQYGKTDYEKWFGNYCKLCGELGDVWSDIWFIADPQDHRLYLKGIVDFYHDLITMTQEKFRILSAAIDAPDDVRNHVIHEIDKYIIYEEYLDRGELKIHVQHNRLTEKKELIFKNVDEIYRDRKISRSYKFEDTLVRKDVFMILTPEQEEAVRSICREIERTNSCEVTMRVPEEIAKVLLSSGYISGIKSDKDGVCGLSCNFIINYYFELKAKLIA